MSGEQTERQPSLPRPVLTLKITLPTKEDVVKALQEKYPGIKVEVEEEAKTEGEPATT